MIGPAPILPPVLGALAPQVNNCDMKSYGWELESHGETASASLIIVRDSFYLMENVRY